MTVSAREAQARSELLNALWRMPNEEAADDFAAAVRALIAAMIAESKQEGGGSDSTRMGHRPDIAEPGQAGLSAKYAEVAKEMGIPLSAPAPQAGEDDHAPASYWKMHWKHATDALRAAVRERDEARTDANRNSAIAREIGIGRFEADAELATLRSVVERAVAVRRALEPLAKVSDVIAEMDAESGFVTPGDMPISEVVDALELPTVDDCHRARAALANPPDPIGDSG